ncbi:MAG: hypothetical protein ABR980_07230 [Ignavibacteriaceae bacterium]|jgi:hypothetical protein
MKTTQNEQLDMVPLPENINKIDIFKRSFRYLKIKDIKSSYSRLIQDFCAGIVRGEDARTLAYLFSTYLTIIRDTESEGRLLKLEKLVQEQNEN